MDNGGGDVGSVRFHSFGVNDGAAPSVGAFVIEDISGDSGEFEGLAADAGENRAGSEEGAKKREGDAMSKLKEIFDFHVS